MTYLERGAIDLLFNYTWALNQMCVTDKSIIIISYVKIRSQLSIQGSW